MHPQMKPVAAAVLLLAGQAGAVAFAAEDLPAVVVTATRQPTRANELLNDVSVVEREQIEAAGQTTLTELLARQPGMEATATGGPGSTSNVFIRGANSDHTLVLVDGIRVNSATLGATSLNRIPLAQIERIEILRGPASALYGSEAIGGVIQIFTRREEGPAKPWLEAGYGSYGTSRLAAGIGGSTEEWRYSASVSQDSVEGISNIGNTKARAYNRDNDGFRNTAGSGSLSYRVAPGHEVGANAFYSDGTNLYDTGFTAAAARKDYRNTNIVSGYSAYVRDRFLPAWTSTLRIGRGTDDSAYYTDHAKASFARTDSDQASWQNDITLPLGRALLALEYLHQQVDASQTYTLHERTIRSALAGWTANVGNHRWQVNVRRDDNSASEGKNTGSVAYGYQLTETWRAQGSFGTAYKAPSFNDLYFPFTAGVGQGNPNLKAESSRSKEIGLLHESSRQQASVTLYQTEITNLIQWQESPVGSFFYTPFNVGKARITGVTGDYRIRTGNLTWRATADFKDPRDATADKELIRRARQTGVIGADYAAGPWSAGAEVQGTGSRYNDAANTQHLGGYALVNLNAAWRFDKDWQLFARVNNLLDKHYEVTKDYGVLGTNVFVGVRYQPK